MALLPVIPNFDEDDSSLSKLQDLVYAVAFLSDADITPVYHAYDSAVTNSITTGAWRSIPGGTIAYDSDNQGTISNNKYGVNIVTQGLYLFEGCADFATGSQISVAISFFLTAGANNPHLAPASTKRFGLRETSSPGPASQDAVVTNSDYSPFPLYPGDQVILMCSVSSTVNQVPLANTSYLQGRFVTNFTSRWVAYAV